VLHDTLSHAHYLMHVVLDHTHVIMYLLYYE
jgi:hypothetical protein